MAETANNFDETTIEAIKANVDGLQIISGQRILVELKKILEAQFGFDILAKIMECGAGQFMGTDIH